MQILDSGKKIIMRTPINMHAHFREGEFLVFLVGIFLKYGWRGIVEAMPNTNDPIITGPQAMSYLQVIRKVASRHPHSKHFWPLVSVQITPKTTVEMLEEALKCGTWMFKIYPYRITTNSEHGVEDYRGVLHLLKYLADQTVVCFDGVVRKPVVMLHPESPRPDVEGLDKEAYFIENELQLILDACSGLSISVEHISTARALRFMSEYGWTRKPGSRIVATVPVQYMCSTLDDVIGYTLRSGFKIWTSCGCKPTPKRRSDLEALIDGVTSGMKCLFAGNDDAWHLLRDKAAIKASCGTGNTLASIPLTLEIFDRFGRLEDADKFLQENPAEFHMLPVDCGEIVVVREDWMIPQKIEVSADDSVVPWMAGETMHWKVL